MNDDEFFKEIMEILDLIIELLKQKLIKDKKYLEVLALDAINFVSKATINVRDNKGRDFIMKSMQMLFEMGTPIKPAICEWMYWFIEGSEAIRYKYFIAKFFLVKIYIFWLKTIYTRII